MNILTIDLEDWYQAIDSIAFNTWGIYEDRILEATGKILDILSENQTVATFFVLGYVAEKYPSLIRKIHREGHEIACHSYGHRKIYNQSHAEFKRDLIMAKDILEQIIGEKVIGFRAPWFSITRKSFWALDILIELGFKYDSSIFPINIGYYGMNNGNGAIYDIIMAKDKKIKEFTVSKIRFLGSEIPVAGGFYFRISPYWLTKKMIERLNRIGMPALTYIHPWELDAAQPRLNLEFDQSVIHYTKLKSTEYKFNRLLEDFKFTSIRNILGKS